MSDDPSNRDDERLGEILRSAVPDGPDPIGRADVVVRRARAANRRRGATGVVAVGAVALAVLVGPNLLDPSGSTSDQAGPGTSPGPQTPPAVSQLADPFTCPGRGEHDRGLTSPPTDEIPLGAVLARICPLSGQGFQLWSPPLDALWTNVDTVAATYNRLPKGQPLPCPARLMPSLGFTVTFQYADGHLVRLSADTSGSGVCNFISVVGRDELGRSHSAEVLSAYLRAIADQRHNGSSPTETSPPTCPADLTRDVPAHAVAPSLIPADPELAMRSAVICEYSTGLFEKPAPRFGTLTRDQVLAVNGEYRSNLTTSPVGSACMAPFPPITLIVGKTIWGDTVVLSKQCAAWERSWPPASETRYWTPSGGLARSLFSRLGR